MTERPERFELRLTNEEAKMLKDLAAGAGLSSADLLRQMIRKQWAESSPVMRQAKMERLALVSLNEMAGRPGMACAVAFVSEPGPRTAPLARPDSGAQPLASNILEAPMLGNLVTQGFSHCLTEKEKAQIEGRFPGQMATWLFNS